MGAGTEVEADSSVDHERMRSTYAVTWQCADGEPRSGRLELGPQGLVFEGSNGDSSASERVSYEELTNVCIARASGERLSGRQTLLLERATGASIRIAGIVQPGIISELAERLASLHVEEEEATSSEPAEYVSFEPTPGPGDSDGGDLF